MVGASGDLADFQEMSDMLDNLSTENAEWMDAHELKPKALHSYLTRVLYNRFGSWDYPKDSKQAKVCGSRTGYSAAKMRG